MWLPMSFFNRVVHFDSTSKSGKTRKHTIGLENIVKGNKRAKRCASFMRGTEGFGS